MSIVVQKSAILMNNFRIFSNFDGEDQHLFHPEFLEISQRTLLHFQKISFEKLEKNKKIKKFQKLEVRKISSNLELE